MDNPLVLYLADSIDARAGAELIRERWAEAELVACPSYQRALVDREAWILGIDPPGPWGDGLTVIDPTPNASIAMQVWRTIHEDACTKCSDMGPGFPQVHPEGVCDACDGAYPPVVPDAPTWLIYLDDAVCGRWALDNSRAVWEAVKAWDPGGCKWTFWQHLVNAPDTRAGMIEKGRAILRARERWEEERDALRAALREALEDIPERDAFGVCMTCSRKPGHEPGCRYVALRELAEVNHD